MYSWNFLSFENKLSIKRKIRGEAFTPSEALARTFTVIKNYKKTNETGGKIPNNTPTTTNAFYAHLVNRQHLNLLPPNVFTDVVSRMGSF